MPSSPWPLGGRGCLDGRPARRSYRLGPFAETAVKRRRTCPDRSRSSRSRLDAQGRDRANRPQGLDQPRSTRASTSSIPGLERPIGCRLEPLREASAPWRCRSSTRIIRAACGSRSQGLGVQYLAPGLARGLGLHAPMSPSEPGFAPFLDLKLVGDDLWVASDGRGLHRYNTVSGNWSRPIRASAEGMPSDHVIGLAAAPGELWVGTWGGGIARLDLGRSRSPDCRTNWSQGRTSSTSWKVRTARSGRRYQGTACKSSTPMRCRLYSSDLAGTSKRTGRNIWPLPSRASSRLDWRFVRDRTSRCRTWCRHGTLEQRVRSSSR